MTKYTTHQFKSFEAMKKDVILEIIVGDGWSHHVQGLGHVPIKFKYEF